eukprot:CAMPEP_0195516296 /NCGR_PEP_ID=MMETSP0794_2-20130614/7066_1 /TAXON_ID=515487 /ORGANISM="Stephanopyxis turris, Strain CCMP 815" /LENGTH=121 /DNA_ID=CAMNT_0040644855 /DNA_START=193 /DNA_END=555 /DNA_ORIENTATION=+
MASSLRDSAMKSMATAAAAVGISRTESEDTETTETNALEEMSDVFPKLTYQQRVIGFGICFGVGYLITFTSFKFFITLVEGKPLPFVCVYTLGNVLSLLSSTFLCGPSKQISNMFHEKRKW